MSKKISKLNMSVLAPMYFNDDYESLCERADGFGMDSLTEDEQYFVDSYNRLDKFMSQLSEDDCNNLHKAIDSDNKSEICEKYSNDEVRFYKSTHKLSNDVRVQELDDLFGGLSNDEHTVDSAQYN